MHRDTKKLTDIMVYSLQQTQAHGPFSDLYPHVPLVETTGLFLLMKPLVPQNILKYIWLVPSGTQPRDNHRTGHFSSIPVMFDDQKVFTRYLPGIQQVFSRYFINFCRICFFCPHPTVIFVSCGPSSLGSAESPAVRAGTKPLPPVFIRRRDGKEGVGMHIIQ